MAREKSAQQRDARSLPAPPSAACLQPSTAGSSIPSDPTTPLSTQRLSYSRVAHPSPLHQPSSGSSSPPTSRSRSSSVARQPSDSSPRGSLPGVHDANQQEVKYSERSRLLEWGRRNRSIRIEKHCAYSAAESAYVPAVAAFDMHNDGFNYISLELAKKLGITVKTSRLKRLWTRLFRRSKSDPQIRNADGSRFAVPLGDAVIRWNVFDENGDPESRVHIETECKIVKGLAAEVLLCREEIERLKRESAAVCMLRRVYPTPAVSASTRGEAARKDLQDRKAAAAKELQAPLAKQGTAVTAPASARGAIGQPSPHLSKEAVQTKGR